MCNLYKKKITFAVLLRTTSGVSRQYLTVTDLATVDTMDDVNRLVNIVDAGYSGSVWIGLKRGTQKRWVWSNGENTQYSTAGEPKNENKCGLLVDGVLNSYSCSTRFYFICYRGEL